MSQAASVTNDSATALPATPSAMTASQSRASSPSRTPPNLDTASWQHVDKLCEQLLTCSKVSVEVYKDPLVDTLRQLERYLQGDVLAQLAASSLAQTKAALDLAHRGPASQPRSGEEQRSHSSMGGWWLQSEETGYTEANQREVWRNAAMLLSADEDERPSPDEKNGESSTSPGHSHDTSINSAFGDDEAWLEIDSLVKVPILSLRVRTVETTLAAVQAGGTSFGLSFAPDLFEGTRLFGRETIDLTPADLKLVEQLGGTFDITATRKSLPRLERILETLAFTVICLLLEAVLLDELSCPRHTPSPSSSPREADCVPSLAPVEPAEGDPDLSITNLDLPGAYKFDEDEPDDDWAHTKRSWRSSFSNGGVLAWMRLVNPRAQLPQAFKPNRALRRSSTVSSNGQSPVTIRTTSSGQDSPTTSPGTSPAHSPSSDRKRSRVSGKLRGLRDQLRGKISHSRPDVASTELPESLGSPRTLQRQKIPGDVGALGLQIVGLSLKPASWQSPWSTNGNRHRADSDTFVLKDNGSTTGTEVTLEEENQPPKRFEKVIEDLSKFILSTSPDVLYPPPHLLFRLRQQELEASLVPPSPSPSQLPSTPPSPSPLLDEAEKAECLVPGYFSSMRPSALQRAHALPSSHSLALNFAGGFAHERDKVSLAAEEKRTSNASTAFRIGLDAKAGLASLMTNNSSLEGMIRHQAMQFLVQVALKDASAAIAPCEPFRWLNFRYHDSSDISLDGFIRRLILRQHDQCPRCSRSNSEHILYLLHHNEKIEVSVMESATESSIAPTNPAGTTTADALLQWYSCQNCLATTPPTLVSSITGSFSFAKFVELVLYDPNFIPVPELCEHASTDRSALVRCFATQGCHVQFKRGSIPLYELRLPTAVDPDVIPSEIEDQASNSADAVGTLLNEISSFFESLQVYVDSLYVRLTKNAIPSPSVNADETSTEDDGGRQHIRSDSERTIIDSTTRPSSPTNPIERALQEEQLEQDDLAQLRLLRTFIEGQRRVCLRHADQTLSQELNMSRSTFYTTATALKVRMSAWEKKHMKALGEEETLASPAFVEPNYFREGVIALPIGSNVLLRPGELSSVLAVALSTPEFKEESRSPSAASSRRVTPSTPSFVPKSRQSSLLRLPIPTFIEPEATPQALDADDMSANFSSVQRFELVAKSKKPPRGTASVFQKLVRKKSGEMTGPSTPTSEHGSFTLDSKKRVVKDTVLNDFLKTKDAPSTLPRSPRAVPSIISGLASRREGSSATTLSLNDDVLAHFTPSVSAAGTIRSKIVPSSLDSTASSNSSSISEVKLEEGSIAGTSNTADHDDGEDQLAPLATELGSNSSRLFDGLRHGLDSLRSRSGSASPKLGAGLADEHCYISEHIKLKISHGESKHSVTAYFAGRFKDLRAKCGLSESLFIESLSRCSDLNPSGGKSSAAFLMTGNQRFMLKELVTKFGYSELESLLTFAPRLLDYQMQADRPSLLSKIFGIYTIKIENLETGEKRKLDMIVMDNLFHSQTISRQFDLKGIASRVAKPKPGEKVKEGSTGWDSDWLEGSVRNQLLLYPHSRRLLLDSVANDVEFLSSNGNIDFSLLVGVDDAQCTLVVGLIDTLGVFNTLKVIEHSAKKALAADAASVTVCPPTEYAKRFLASMETYFVAVPDKWSKPPIGSGQEMDPDPRLPCPL